MRKNQVIGSEWPISSLHAGYFSWKRMRSDAKLPKTNSWNLKPWVLVKEDEFNLEIIKSNHFQVPLFHFSLVGEWYLNFPSNQPSKNSRRSNLNDCWLSKELSNSAASLAIATAFFCSHIHFQWEMSIKGISFRRKTTFQLAKEGSRKWQVRCRTGCLLLSQLLDWVREFCQLLRGVTW